MLSYTTARTVQQFTTQNACRVQLTYTGYVCNVYLFVSGVDVVSGTPYASDTTTNNPKVIISNLNVAGIWNFVIHHGITSNVTTLTPFTLDIKTFTDSECTNFCTGKAYSAGLAGGTTNICNCVTGFSWSSAYAACIVNCAAISKATTIVSGSQNTCNCQTNYTWDSTNAICYVPCASLTNGVSLVSGTIDTCNCATGFYWQLSSFTCLRNCSASAIPYSTGAAS